MSRRAQDAIAYHIWYKTAACPNARRRDLAIAHSCVAPRNLTRLKLRSRRRLAVRILTRTGVECYVFISTPSLRVLTSVCCRWPSVQPGPFGTAWAMSTENPASSMSAAVVRKAAAADKG